MKKFLSWYKGLPKEVKLALMLIGFGSPAGIIFMLKRHVFTSPNVSVADITIGFALAIVGIALICWLVSTFFTRGRKQRSQRMASDLARDDQGPLASMDVKAAIKSNNEKFFNAVRDMRKNLGVDVYDLPWYIVIGDSGCGKTRLINNGGLTFSTGKPEGYQLGTLNYNWWFTEDAVFVDMAGRLCNPQDDADHREWQAFLDTIARGRKGFPINGAFVCVSAEHLLQDSPEKHEADANTALERLRELQGRLGVTFATHLIITKCDKILGFMQFFDRAERDITVKNQIFGWAKPDEFDKLYDPEAFHGDFFDLYHRLNDLRLRRLQDDVSDADLGLAYSFPEEFRQLRDPLQTYVRTLFPMIRNPRAMKNLIFRGIFFTSATQEGAVILKHLAQRLGAEAADQFPSLDQLYPEKRPLFVKDVFFRKAFPEQGLVFRNENDVVRNQKLARLVKAGSALMSLLLIALLGLGYWKLNTLITTPLQHAQQTHSALITLPKESLQRGAEFSTDMSELARGRFWAGLLSWGLGTDQPVKAIRFIRARLFEESQLKLVLEQVDRSLRTDVAITGEGADPEKFLAALKEYVRWLGCSARESAPTNLKPDSFRTLYGVISPHTVKDSVLTTSGDGAATPKLFQDRAAEYFDTVQSAEKWNNPARFMTGDVSHRVETVQQAMALAYEHYWKRFATLTDQNGDPTIREWMRIWHQCDEVQTQYEKMLQESPTQPKTGEDLNDLRDRFAGAYGGFETALDACAWRAGRSPKGDIPSLLQALLDARKRWREYERDLLGAYNSCDPSKDERITKAILALAATDGDATADGLDPFLWKELVATELATGTYTAGVWADLESDPPDVMKTWRHVIEDPTAKDSSGKESPEGAKKPLRKVELTADAKNVQTEMKRLRDALPASGGDAAAGDQSTPEEWITELEAILKSKPAAPQPVALQYVAEDEWNAKSLKGLQSAHEQWMQRGRGTALLTRMAGRLEHAGEEGIGAVFPDHVRLERLPSAYVIRSRQPRDPSPRVTEPPSEPQPSQEKPRERSRRRSRQTDEPAETKSGADVSRPSSVDQNEGIPAWSTRGFLDDRLYEVETLLDLLQDLKDAQYYGDKASGKDVRNRCVEALKNGGRRYIAFYVDAWALAYTDKTIADLPPLKSSGAWSDLAGKMSDKGLSARVGDDLQHALKGILETVGYWRWLEEKKGWYDWTSDTKKSLETVGWFDAAFKAENPRKLGFFTTTAFRKEWWKDHHPTTPPWDIIAQRCRGIWDAQTAAIQNCADIPREFTRDTRACGDMKWGELSRLRSECGLDTEERVTGEMLLFENHAKQLLDQELTAVLLGVQTRHGVAGDGWPYAAGNDAAAFRRFQSFLVEMIRAEQVLAALEKGLESAPGYLRRKTFYDQCRQWREFLDLPEGGGAAGPKNLTVAVQGLNPFDGAERPKNVEPPANFYSYVHFQLGLNKTDGTALPADGAKWLAELAELTQPQSFAWTWADGGADMSLKLSGGSTRKIEDAKGKPMELPPLPDYAKPLGKTSPLSLPDYVRRLGAPDTTRRKWTIVETVDLLEFLKDKGPLLQAVKDSGVTHLRLKFQFDLARPLPEEIKRLGA